MDLVNMSAVKMVGGWTRRRPICLRYEARACSGACHLPLEYLAVRHGCYWRCSAAKRVEART